MVVIGENMWDVTSGKRPMQIVFKQQQWILKALWSGHVCQPKVVLPFHVIHGTLNSKKCNDTMLEPKLLPSIRELFTDNAPFFLQQDSTSWQSACICEQWLTDNHIKMIRGPRNIPDLNHLEHFWLKHWLTQCHVNVLLHWKIQDIKLN